MKKVIIIVVILIILGLVALMLIKKQAKKKIELNTFGGMTKDEFKNNLQMAWKDRYFQTTTEALMKPEDWAKTWRNQIEQSIQGGDKSLQDAILETVQFSWAKDQPKANDNTWSAGWLREIYVKQDLGINPIPPEVLAVVNSI